MDIKKIDAEIEKIQIQINQAKKNNKNYCGLVTRENELLKSKIEFLNSLVQEIEKDLEYSRNHINQLENQCIDLNNRCNKLTQVNKTLIEEPDKFTEEGIALGLREAILVMQTRVAIAANKVMHNYNFHEETLNYSEWFKRFCFKKLNKEFDRLLISSLKKFGIGNIEKWISIQNFKRQLNNNVHKVSALPPCDLLFLAKNQLLPKKFHEIYNLIKNFLIMTKNDQISL